MLISDVLSDTSTCTCILISAITGILPLFLHHTVAPKIPKSWLLTFHKSNETGQLQGMGCRRGQPITRTTFCRGICLRTQERLSGLQRTQMACKSPAMTCDIRVAIGVWVPIKCLLTSYRVFLGVAENPLLYEDVTKFIKNKVRAPKATRVNYC